MIYGCCFHPTLLSDKNLKQGILQLPREFILSKLFEHVIVLHDFLRDTVEVGDQWQNQTDYVPNLFYMIQIRMYELTPSI